MKKGSADLRLRQLECFVRLAEVRNFSEAAKSLYLSQSALSAQIKSLEDEFGKPLFIRAGRSGVTLTEEGSILLTTSKEILRDVHHAAARIDRLRTV